MPQKDLEARRAYCRAYNRKRFAEDPDFRARHMERVNRNDAKYRALRSQVLSEFRALGCKCCDEKDECCLEAHHIEPEHKEFDIGNMLRKKVSPKSLVAELEKCVCLCANCHRKLHAGRIKLM